MPVPLKRMIVLAASSLLLCAILITIRGISHTQGDHPMDGKSALDVDSQTDLDLQRIVELDVQVSMSDSSFQILQALNRSFMARYPGFTVNLMNVHDEDRYDHLLEAFRMEEPPDLILLDNEQLMKFVVKAYIQPMDVYFTRDTGIEYLSAMTQQLAWNGYIWGIPFHVQPYILAYHDQVWHELTGEVTPSSIGHLWDVYLSGQLFIDGDDPLGYAALAGALDPGWQFPLVQPDFSPEESVPDVGLAGFIKRESDVMQTRSVSAKPERSIPEPGTVMLKPETSEAESGSSLTAPDASEAEDEQLSVTGPGSPVTETGIIVTGAGGDRPEAGSEPEIGREGNGSSWPDPAKQFNESEGEGLWSEASHILEVTRDTQDILIAEQLPEGNAETAHESKDEDAVQEDMWSRLLSGEIAGLITTLHAYESHRGEGISFAILPSASREGALFLSGQSFVVSSDTSDKDAAFLWVREILQEYNDLYPAGSLGAYPAIKKAYTDISNISPYHSFRNAIEKGRAPLPDLLWNEKLPIVQKHLEASHGSRMTIDEVMMQIYEEFEANGLLNQK